MAESIQPRYYKSRIKIESYASYVDVYFTEDIFYVVNMLSPGLLSKDEADGYSAGFFKRNHPRKKGVTEFFMVLGIHDLSANAIAHESMHFTAAFMDYHGAILDSNNDEPYCYLIGYVVGKIHAKAAKLGFLIKDK